jgi:hypothetical protein
VGLTKFISPHETYTVLLLALVPRPRRSDLEFIQVMYRLNSPAGCAVHCAPLKSIDIASDTAFRLDLCREYCLELAQTPVNRALLLRRSQLGRGLHLEHSGEASTQHTCFSSTGAAYVDLGSSHTNPHRTSCHVCVAGR